MSTVALPPGVAISAPISAEHARVLTPGALDFLAMLERAFAPRRAECLAARAARQREFDAGALPQFLDSTRAVRDGAWTCAAIPADILDRRVEITGPVDRKMVINALNSGANVFMADFEDANTPTWSNNLDGQVNLVDAVRKRMSILRADGVLYVKGAVDLLLPLCTSGTEGIAEKNAALAARGLRVLAIAVGRGKVEEDLTLLGLIGMADPPLHRWVADSAGTTPGLAG